MTQVIIYPYGTKKVTVPVGQYIIIAAYEGDAKVYLGVSDPNMPTVYSYYSTVTNTESTLGTWSSAQDVRIDAGPGNVYYNVGASPTISLPTPNTLAGTGDPFALTGEAGTQGGAVNVTGGTSSTSANAGGAVAITGGTPGATGTGGAVTITSGAGGATSGVSGAVAVSSGSTTAASATGAVSIGSGAGAASAAATAGGASGTLTVSTGAGGANTGGATGEAGGAGGAMTVSTGAGGATNSTGAHDGGAGGDLGITAGNGGAASAGTGDGGDGGTITLTPGTGGATTGGAVGAIGQVKAAGLFALNTAQVLDMSDATVQLTVDPGSTAGTVLTSNIMMVDPNSSGAGEDLELPPEADVPGVVLWIYNTGGENIVVKDDSGGTTVDTVATTEFGFFFCDGTAWHGMNAA
jgi:hypothetical protein